MTLGQAVAWLIAGVCTAPVPAQTTTRVSLDSAGVEGNSHSVRASISADGRWVAFGSLADNLVPGDLNLVFDVFVHDRQSGTTTLVSTDSAGTQGNATSDAPSVSADGRYVAFFSAASNFVAADTNGTDDVFLRDCQVGSTERLSMDSSGIQGNNHSQYPSISADGRYVAFISLASNFVIGDTNGTWDVFVYDRQSGTTERDSLDSAWAEGNGGSYDPRLSDDGRYVVFRSSATNLVPGDTNGSDDIFIRDRFVGTTYRVSIDSHGAQANGGSAHPWLSGDGRYVAFSSLASNLVRGDTNGDWDVFLHDQQTATTTRVSVDSSGVPMVGGSPSISADGRYVAFDNGSACFVHDLLSGTTTRIDVDSMGAPGNDHSYGTCVSADGRCTAFTSYASNLVPGDGNAFQDVFVRDLGSPPPFSIMPFCAGDGAIVPCPCGNDGLLGHGCNNSIGNGGAILAGVGEATLSADTFILAASSERPTASSMFWQGDQEIAPRVFGDGVGCMGGHLKRLFFHNAVGGSVAAPQGSDASVSARSASVGNPISPGTIRIYHVFYRDPDPTFCPAPAGATFNTTNGLRVLWGP